MEKSGLRLLLVAAVLLAVSLPAVAAPPDLPSPPNIKATPTDVPAPPEHVTTVSTVPLCALSCEDERSDAYRRNKSERDACLSALFMLDSFCWAEYATAVFAIELMYSFCLGLPDGEPVAIAERWPLLVFRS